MLEHVTAEIAEAGGELKEDPEAVGSIGRTMFDLNSSEDDTITVVLPKENIQRAPSQAMLRIKSREDKRTYLGIVVSGPFAEPDNLKGDSPIIITIATQGGILMPRYHGRVEVEILAEETLKGALVPPRYRPLPNSYVFALSDAEAQDILKAGGQLRLGRVVGRDEIEVGIPPDAKFVLPRHTALLGTTGAGKSTTASGLIVQALEAGLAVVLLDVEGEYTTLHEPTDDPRMIEALAEQGRTPGGVDPDKMTVYHLVGREPKNPKYPHLRPFSLQFARLSPHAVAEILEMTDAQEERFFKAYDVTKEIMRDFGIFPRGIGSRERPGDQPVTKADRDKDEQMALEIDEFERGYPRMRLALLRDVVQACASLAAKEPVQAERFVSRAIWHLPAQHGEPPAINEDRVEQLISRIRAAQIPGDVRSWRKLWGRLNRLDRLAVFDREDARPLSYKSLLRPGRLSVIDLSDTEMAAVSNLVIADLLRGMRDEQDKAYTAYERAKGDDAPAQLPTRALVVVEEAHEFLSEARIEKMPVLFEQVAKIAKRGRKAGWGSCS